MSGRIVEYLTGLKGREIERSPTGLLSHREPPPCNKLAAELTPENHEGAHNEKD